MMAPTHWKGFAVIVLATAIAVWLVVPLIGKGISKVSNSSAPAA